MKTFPSLILSTAALLCACGAALAAEQTVGPLSLTSIAVIGAVPTAGHLAGNVEINVGWVGHGLACTDHTYITTRQTTDKDRAMLTLLRSAKDNSRQIALRISDDPLINAFPTRCSLVGVELH